jgi:hypothetical protein
VYFWTNSALLGYFACVVYPVGARIPSVLLPIAFANSASVGAVENAAILGWYFSCCRATIRFTPSWYCEPPTTMSAFESAIFAATPLKSVVLGG